MKRMMYVLLALCLVISMTACGKKPTKQVASAYLDQDGTTVTVTVDLTGGWSVEFARGAFYLYDDKHTIEEEAVAIGITLDEEVFYDHMKEALEDANRKEMPDGIVYSTENDTNYLVNIEDSAYFMLVQQGDVSVEDLWKRVTVKLDK